MRQFVEQTMQDLRFGVRSMRKNLGLTLTLLLTLALGIGVNTAIFSVVNAVLLRPLPFRDPQRLVIVREKIPMFGADAMPMAPPDVRDIQDNNHVLAESAAFEEKRFDLNAGGRIDRVAGARTSASMFDLLGVKPRLGRSFTGQEDADSQPVVVISDALCRSLFSDDDRVLGRSVQIDRKPYSIIGVMPKDFVFPLQASSKADAAQLWIPMSFTPQELSGRDWYDFDMIARLKPGVTVAAAQTELSAVTAAMYDWMAKDHPELTVSAAVIPLSRELVKKARQPLILLMAATLCVLLIACGNIAMLLLTRATARRRETAFRIALGAKRERLIRALLVENLLLSVAGGGLGVWLAWWCVRFATMLLPANIPQVTAIHIDPAVFLFAGALTVATALLSGVLPAALLTRVPVSEALKGSSHTNLGSASGRKTRSALITAQIAITAVLLISASLLVRSMLRVLRVDPGIRTENLVTMSVFLPPAQYAKGAQVSAFYRDLLERVRRAPGISGVSASTSLPMSGGWRRRFLAEGHPAPSQSQMQLIANSAVQPDYFRVMGIPLRAGRFFTAEEEQSGAPVVIISEGMARQYWPNENPVGKRMRFSETLPWMTITGIVGDVKQGALDQSTAPQAYEPYAELGEDGAVSVGRDMYVIVRASDIEAAIAAVRNGVRELDPQEPVTRIRTMQKVLDSTLVPRRFNTTLFVGFALTALLLATLGIYGTVAYSVRTREAEIGLRMALGAQRSQVLALTLREGVRLALVGVAVGVVASLAATRLLSGLLYSVAPADAVSFVTAVAMVMVVAVAASYLPARRAMGVDPIAALRSE